MAFPPRLIMIVLIAFSLGALAAVGMLMWDRSGPAYSGKALIGGPFTLTNQRGQTVTDRTFRGQYMLVAFGYTHCPDVCPAELSMMSTAMEKLGDKAGGIVPIFITIDPQRDTAEQLASYLSSFHPRMVGLTGTKEEVRKAASAYRVYYAKAHSGSSNDSYLMDHSVYIYLMDPQGEYLTHFTYGISAETLATRIAEAMGG